MHHVLESSLLFRPRMGGWNKSNASWRRILRSKIRKIAVAEKQERGGNSFPHTFFFPPRPRRKVFYYAHDTR
jgi:hypothetical protein